jgi:hypothetical protein
LGITIQINDLKINYTLLFKKCNIMGGNNNFYHYSIVKQDDEGIEHKKFYMTLFEIMDEYKVSRGTLANLLNGRIKKSSKMGLLKISRVRIPRYLQVPNPEFTS